MRTQPRLEGRLMTLIIALLAVAAIASWSEWSVTTAPATAAPAATERLSPTEPPAASRSIVEDVPADADATTAPRATTTQTPAGPGPAGAMTMTATRAVALTFDDGPDPVTTPRILDLLRSNGVKATFCVIGTLAHDHPELVRRIAAEGHTLCNHSWRHLLDLGSRSPADIRDDLARTNDAIHAAVPGAPIMYFRAPGGNFTPTLSAAARTLGMTPLYWQVDPRDWDTATIGVGPRMVEHVVSVVRAAVHPGAIVLSHDSGHPDTVTAYTALLPWLKAHFTLAALPN